MMVPAAMYTRIFVVALAGVQTSLAIRGYAPLDYENFAIPIDGPVELENKVFTTDGFDPAAELIKESELEAKEFTEGKEKMDKEFKEIENRAHHEGPVKLSDLKKYTPHIKKLEIGS